MITDEEFAQDMQYLRNITGVLGRVFTISKDTKLYSISTATAVSHAYILKDIPFSKVCGIHPLYNSYMDLGEDLQCKHLTYTTIKPLRILDLHKYSLLYNSRLYRSLLLRTDEIDGVLCRALAEGPLELILYNNTDSLLQLSSSISMDYSTFESLDDWPLDIMENESSLLYSAIAQTSNISL